MWYNAFRAKRDETIALVQKKHNLIVSGGIPWLRQRTT